jgi:hypothetical protein
MIVYRMSFQIVEGHNYGAVRSILNQLNVSPTAAPWLLLPAWSAGCYMSLDLLQRILGGRDLRDQFLGAGILLYMASLVLSTVAFERYYQLIVAAIVFMGVPKTRQAGGYVMIALWHFVFLALTAVRLAKDLL